MFCCHDALSLSAFSISMLFLLLSLASLFSLNRGWSYVGHDISARVAFSKLSVNGDVYVRTTLGVDDLDGFIAASVWADTLEAAEFADYHFVHSPYRTTAVYDEARDCGFNGSGRCLVTGLARFVTVLMNEASSALEKKHALRMVIHLMGDLHQPLHSGYAKDFGGAILTIAQPAGFTLHEMWDSYLLAGANIAAIQDPSETLLSAERNYLSSTWPIEDENAESIRNRVKEWVGSVVSEMSMEYTTPLAYRDGNEWIEKGAVLSDAYMFSRTDLAAQLASLAGVRMSLLLNRIAKILRTREGKLMEEKKLLEIIPLTAIPSNRFAELSIEDFDFYPEELVSVYEESDKSDVAPEETGPARSADFPDLRYGVDMKQLRLKQQQAFWLVTSRSRLNAHAGSITCFDVQFPLNTKNNKMVICFDLLIFSDLNAIEDTEFLVEIIARIRSRLPGGRKKNSASSAKQAGAKNPTLSLRSALWGMARLTYGYPEMRPEAIEHAIAEAKFMQMMQGIPDGEVCGALRLTSPCGDTILVNLKTNEVTQSPEVRNAYFRQLRMLSELGGRKDPRELDSVRRIYIWQHFQIKRKCATDLVMLVVGKGSDRQFFTTMQALTKTTSRQAPSLQFKALIYEMRFRGANSLTLVDFDLLPLSMDADINVTLHDCTIVNRHVYSSGDPGPFADQIAMLDELYSTLLTLKDQREPPVTKTIDRIMTYPIQLPDDNANIMVEWNTKK